MFWYGRKNLQIEQFTSTSAGLPRVRLARIPQAWPPLEVTPIRLAVSMAKAKLTADPRYTVLAIEAAATYVRLQFSIASKGNNLRVVDDFRSLYRDFSFHAYVGELGQAVSFLFAQERLGFPVVVDFEGFLRRFNYGSGGTRTPD
jgi:hypothetical protein